MSKENKKAGRPEIYAGGSTSKSFKLPTKRFQESAEAVYEALKPFRVDYVKSEEVNSSKSSKITGAKILTDCPNCKYESTKTGIKIRLAKCDDCKKSKN